MSSEHQDDNFTMVVKSHIFKRRAITSYAMIIHTIHKGKLLYLLGNIRDTIPYREFIYGSIQSKDIPRYISSMTKAEKKRILENDIYHLLDDMRLHPNSHRYQDAISKEEEFENKKRQHTALLEDEKIGLNESPWIFPKGKKWEFETDLDCALREFEEETCIPSSFIHVNSDIEPLEEIYHGMDGNLYRIVYFVGFLPFSDFKWVTTTFNDFVISQDRITLSAEITKIKWFSYDEAVEKLDLPKRMILRLVNTQLIFDLPRQNNKRRYSL